MKKLRLLIIGILLFSSSGCFPVFAPAHGGHGGHGHHDHGGGRHGDRD